MSIADRLERGEGDARFCEAVEVGKEYIGLPVVEDLVVRELIHQNPDDAGLGCRDRRKSGAFEASLFPRFEAKRVICNAGHDHEEAEPADCVRGTDAGDAAVPDSRKKQQ